MSSSNQLEIISRGSVEMLSPESNPAPDANRTTDAKSDQHIFLEPLPPERPRYSGQPDMRHKQTQAWSGEEMPPVDSAASELEHSRLQTESLLHRMEELSGRIRSGLSLMENTGATVSLLPRDEDCSYCDDVMMMSLVDETDQSMAEAPQSEGGKSPSQATVMQREGVKGEGEQGEEEGEGGGRDSEERGVASPQAEVDPKLLKALEKMRRLDRKLADLVKREREVKQQTRELEEQVTASEVECYSPYRIEEGIPAVSPVFPTQVLDDIREPGEAGGSLSTEYETDFVQRNIEQVSGAGAVVVLSEAEKQRLEQLLAQDEDDDTETEGISSGPVVVSTAAEDSGFSFSSADQATLRNIDVQLQALGHSAASESAYSSHDLSAPESQMSQLTKLHISHGTENQKLREIDERLNMLQNDCNSSSEALPPSVLHSLLEQCVKEQQLS